MRILITGANGFIAKNLIIRLKEKGITQIDTFLRSDSENRLQELVNQADLIFHLAGENRPQDPQDFEKNNVQLKVIAHLIEVLQVTQKMIQK